ncbi:putative glutamine ABC transporter permease protein GlnM [Paenibacillus sp. J23TS9]|uniref:amino acid ABC transporter permease n=1 Tax=Paenibacillus sp. J23TS9 TaxID=2807193 RepID=UPI001B214247|nr:amino acid ABC transporter permease [Paenibacillus sp. J23TS9]GIP29361.1 putative glutamine ABC transporter permease protein GlnM [Paenibacillus sp. J23TS9]
MLDFSILIEHKKEFLAGFLTTLEVSLLALVLSLILGTVLAVMKISPLKPLKGLATVYIEFIQNTPLLIQIFFFYFGLPAVGIQLNPFISGTLGLAVYSSAYIAEAIRAGIQAVSHGQVEAGRASGLTYIQTMLHIILPQAIKVVIPPLGNQFLNLVMGSAILGSISGKDLMYYGDIISSDTFVVFDVYIFVALFYLILTVPLSLFINYLERKLSASD